MLKSEMQQKYWVTKKTVQRKFGSKEDECIVSSDAELDAKIELFKSINESCIHLHRVIDNYQERICILAQEENALGKFLKETGKGSATSGKVMNTTGKSLSYCGQQRMTMRPSLLRLLQEVETFRGRAVIDTHMTIQAMERERTEYRAALSWMKSASELDPDTGRGLDKFRKAQQHVRASKAKFDSFTLDCLQKIDLLAAARCNMFSQALVAYQLALMDFFTKTSETFQTTIISLSKEPHYSFTILKELTQGEPPTDRKNSVVKEDDAIDSDQLLFFKDDYKDEEPMTSNRPSIVSANKTENLRELGSQLIDIVTDNDYDALLQPTMQLLNDLSVNRIENNKPSSENTMAAASKDLLGLADDDFGDFMSSVPYMPSQMMLDDMSILNADGFGAKSDVRSLDTPSELLQPSVSGDGERSSDAKAKGSILDLFKSLPAKSNKSDDGAGKRTTNRSVNKEKVNPKNKANWFDLFAELDPLANPDSIEKKLSGGHSNSQAA